MAYALDAGTGRPQREKTVVFHFPVAVEPISSSDLVRFWGGGGGTLSDRA